mmetsp:Transcript_36476/g.79836  ORF Transcript_36476/g.79836 Transcript_36476/m.79836 type:complete len:505 (-) Transcript_36476:186-1700(-)
MPWGLRLVNSEKLEYDENLLGAAAENRVEIVRRFMEACGKPEQIRDATGRTMLHRAAMEGSEDVLVLLLQYPKRKIDVQDNNGHTALHLAAASGFEACVRRLAASGATLDARDKYGCTALRLAAQWEWPACVRALLELRADPLVEDRLGYSAADTGRVSPNKEVVELLAGFAKPRRPSRWRGLRRCLMARRDGPGDYEGQTDLQQKDRNRPTSHPPGAGVGELLKEDSDRGLLEDSDQSSESDLSEEEYPPPPATTIKEGAPAQTAGAAVPPKAVVEETQDKAQAVPADRWMERRALESVFRPDAEDSLHQEAMEANEMEASTADRGAGVGHMDRGRARSAPPDRRSEPESSEPREGLFTSWLGSGSRRSSSVPRHLRAADEQDGGPRSADRDQSAERDAHKEEEEEEMTDSDGSSSSRGSRDDRASRKLMHFDASVVRLGFEVEWSGEEPLVNNIIPGEAAEARGLLQGDVITAINGAATLGKGRIKLLPLLKSRPLELTVAR